MHTAQLVANVCNGRVTNQIPEYLLNYTPEQL